MRAVLFDLDGTLLDINLGEFLGRYFSALTEVMSEIVPRDQVEHAMGAVNAGTEAMMRPHPGQTNYEVFWQEVHALAGIHPEAHGRVFDTFYEERFPALGDCCGPVEGATQAIQAARDSGLKVAVATNPIFPRRAVEHRMMWAGIAPDSVDAITTYESMYACKPHAAYYKQTAQMIDVPPTECMMVGDDPVLDMAATDVGMDTFYVGAGSPGHCSYSGTLADVATLIPRLV